jgi:hypothetical protein
MKEPCFVHYGNAMNKEPCHTVLTDVLYPGQKVKMADGSRRVLQIDPNGPDYVLYHGKKCKFNFLVELAPESVYTIREVRNWQRILPLYGTG